MDEQNLRNLATVIAKAFSQEVDRIEQTLCSDADAQVLARETKDRLARKLCTEILRAAKVESNGGCDLCTY